MKVIVVGGSIGGCASAHYLGQAGHEVEVIERSTHLASQGIAVGAPAAALTDMIATGLLPPDFPRCASHTLDYLTRGAHGEAACMGSIPLSWATMRWRDLHVAMRARVAADKYRTGQTVTAVHTGPDGRPAITIDNQTRAADLVVLADGNRSLARAIGSFTPRRRYTGLALLRGLVPESGRADHALDDRLTRTMFPGGHAVSYTVPGTNGHIAPGHRDVMWGIYLTVPEQNLTEVTATAVPRTAAGPPADALVALTPARRSMLLQQVLPALPDAWIPRVDHTDSVHLQPVFDATTDALHTGRVCLVGDAGSVSPPFNANGVVKAVRMASSLAAALPAAPHGVETALAAWSERELNLAREEHQAAQHLRTHLIEGVPNDLSTDGVAAGDWLRALHPHATPTPSRHTHPQA